MTGGGGIEVVCDMSAEELEVLGVDASLTLGLGI